MPIRVTDISMTDFKVGDKVIVDGKYHGIVALLFGNHQDKRPSITITPQGDIRSFFAGPSVAIRFTRAEYLRAFPHKDVPLSAKSVLIDVSLNKVARDED